MRWVWRDGRPEPGTPPDPGEAASGVFTTAGCEGGRPLLWDRHAARLARDAVALESGPPPAVPTASELAALLAAAGVSGPGRLRVTAWLEGGQWRVGAAVAPLAAAGPGLPPLELEPVRWKAPPPLAGHKTLARLPWEAAAAAARRRGADDALLVDGGERVLETSVANVWAILGHRAVTPPAPRRCLPGVLREWLLDSLARAGLRAEARDLTLEELEAADEVWVSNAVVGIRRVRRAGRRRWDAWPAFARAAALPPPAPGFSRPGP